MRLVIRVLGCEVFAVDTTPEPAPEAGDHVYASRHAGEFGFGASPAHPYWTPEPGESPAVAAFVLDPT